MDTWPAERIGLCLAQHFAGHGSSVPLAKRQELQQVGDRVSLGPAEVRMRDLAGAIAAVQQQRGNRIRDRRADAAEDVMGADLRTGDLQRQRKLRYVPWPDLDEQHALVR